MSVRRKTQLLCAAIVVVLSLNLCVVFLSPLGHDLHAMMDSLKTAKSLKQKTEVRAETTTPVIVPPKESAEEKTEAAVAVETAAAEPVAAEVMPEPVKLKYPVKPMRSEDGTVYNPIPYISQLDYPKEPYGTGTIATSGCTLTALSMVATYLTGEEVFPDDLAKRYMKASGSLIQRMEAASMVMDLKFRSTSSFAEMMAALQEGKVVMVLMDADSVFVPMQHVLVLWGITADGNVLLHDPLSSNYQREELRSSYGTGFTKEMIQKGFNSAWIYEFYEPPIVGPTNYAEIELTADEKDLLAKLIWQEARGESLEGQQAVAETVFNRMLSNQFPTNTLKGTIMAEGQFRSKNALEDTKADELQYKAIDRALSGPNVLPMDVYYFARYKTNENVWGVIDEHIFCGAE